MPLQTRKEQLNNNKQSLIYRHGKQGNSIQITEPSLRYFNNLLIVKLNVKLRDNVSNNCTLSLASAGRPWPDSKFSGILLSIL
jgi:hypothetical protein